MWLCLNLQRMTPFCRASAYAWFSGHSPRTAWVNISPWDKQHDHEMTCGDSLISNKCENLNFPKRKLTYPDPFLHTGLLFWVSVDQCLKWRWQHNFQKKLIDQLTGRGMLKTRSLLGGCLTPTSLSDLKVKLCWNVLMVGHVRDWEPFTLGGRVRYIAVSLPTY